MPMTRAPRRRRNLAATATCMVLVAASMLTAFAALYGVRSLPVLGSGTLAVTALLLAHVRWKDAEDPHQVGSVVVDAEGVQHTRGDGSAERVRWSNLVEVDIVTTDEGPYFEDLYWLLTDEDGKGCVVAGGDPAVKELLDRLQRLPRFDHAAVIDACGTTNNAWFVCWRGRPGEGLASAGRVGTASEVVGRRT